MQGNDLLLTGPATFSQELLDALRAIEGAQLRIKGEKKRTKESHSSSQ